MTRPRASLDGVTIRPITGADEIALFNRLPYTINHELADDLAEGRRRPEWMWVAVRDDRLLARVAWWSHSGADTPLLLDILDLDDGAEDLTAVALVLFETAAAQVIPAGSTPPEYGRFIPPDWREDPAAHRAVRSRMTVLEQTGVRLTVERLRLQWSPGTELPAEDQRLAFRAVTDDGELVALMTRALDGTLDAHGRADLAPIIAYLGVVPEHRGRGYVHGILAEGTRILAGEHVPRIRAATDLGNTPHGRCLRPRRLRQFRTRRQHVLGLTTPGRRRLQ